MIKNFLGGVAALAALLSTPVFAADMAARPLYKAPPPPAPVYTWSGCYIGGNLGGAWTHKQFQFNTENEGSMTPGGFAGGGQVGCDYQFAPNWLVGIQGMFDGASISGTDIDPNADGDTYPTTLHWFGTLTGRLGFLATPSVLVYGKGGAAWVNETVDVVNNNFAAQGSSGNLTRNGWTVGAGVEWMLAPSWSLLVEYDHMDFGTDNVALSGVALGGPFTFTEQIKQSIDQVLVGVNWRFNPGYTSAAVSSRY
jgi:outer membrane immunogenic protein